MTSHHHDHADTPAHTSHGADAGAVPGETRAVLRLDLAGAADAERDLAPASVLLRADRAVRDRLVQTAAHPQGSAPSPPTIGGFEILAIDAPAEIDAHPAAAAAERLDLAGSVLLPGLANAHTHLDLTDVGPIELASGDHAAAFAAWLAEIRTRRPADDTAAAAAVRRGVALSEASGVAAVGDIAGAVGPNPRPATVRALMDTPMLGVGFLEFFAIGAAERANLRVLGAALDTLPPAGSGVRPGLQPHAPYSVGLGGYERATELAFERDLPLSTHLAETLDERRCIAEAAGPLRALLDQLGLWDGGLAQTLGRGRHPIEHVAPALAAARQAGRPFLAAHVADAPDDMLPRLAETGVTVAYCPRTAEHFGTPDRLGPHRYRAMLDAGIPVCLGTDSVASLPPEASDPAAGAFGPLAEARRLFHRDRADPATLLSMITTTPARALGLDPAAFRLDPGRAIAGLALTRTGPTDGVGAREALLASDAPPRLLVRRIPV